MSLWRPDSGLEIIQSVQIEASIEKVFDTLIEVDSHPDVYPGCDRVVKLDEKSRPIEGQKVGRLSPGLRYIFCGSAGGTGRERKWTLTVTRLEQGPTQCTLVTATQMFGCTITSTSTLERLGQNMTEFRQAYTLIPDSLVSRLYLFVRSSVVYEEGKRNMQDGFRALSTTLGVHIVAC